METIIMIYYPQLKKDELTVKDLIQLLRRFPENYKVSICGMDGLNIAAQENKRTVVIDDMDALLEQVDFKELSEKQELNIRNNVTLYMADVFHISLDEAGRKYDTEAEVVLYSKKGVKIFYNIEANTLYYANKDGLYASLPNAHEVLKVGFTEKDLFKNIRAISYVYEELKQPKQN